MSQNEQYEESIQRNVSGLASSNSEKQQDSSASEELTSPQNTSSSASTSALANTPGDIDQLPIEHIPEPDSTPKTERNVKAEIFFREDPKSESPEEDKKDDSLSGSTSNLIPPPTPPVDDTIPPASPAIPPRNLNIPSISVSTEDSVVPELSATAGNPTGTKPKATLGDAFNKLVGRLSPSTRKKSLTPGSDSSITPESSIASQIGISDKQNESKVEDVQPSCSSSDQSNTKKPKTISAFFKKDKTPKNSPGKKKSQSRLKSAFQKVLNPRKKTSSLESEPLCNIDDPPKTKGDKSKRVGHWGDGEIPKDFQKEESIDFSETTVDSNSTQYSMYSITTDSITSDQVNVVPTETLQQNNPDIPPIDESPEHKSEDCDKSEQ